MYVQALAKKRFGRLGWMGANKPCWQLTWTRVFQKRGMPLRWWKGAIDVITGESPPTPEMS